MTVPVTLSIGTVYLSLQELILPAMLAAGVAVVMLSLKLMPQP